MNHHRFVSLNKKKSTISPLRQRGNPKKRMKIKKKCGNWKRKSDS